MKKTFEIIWKVYSGVGVVWLTFTILSATVFNNGETQQVNGEITQIIETTWNGYSSIDAIIEIDDGLGKVMASLYRPRVNEGNNVAVRVRTGGASDSYIHASVMSDRTQ